MNDGFLKVKRKGWNGRFKSKDDIDERGGGKWNSKID